MARAGSRAVRLRTIFLLRSRGASTIIAQYYSTDIDEISTLLRRCDSAKFLLEGKRIHDHIIKIGLHKDRFICNLLVQMYGKCGEIRKARDVFNNILRPNCFSWNIMFTAYIQHDLFKEAKQLFLLMPEPNIVSWNAMVAACVQHGQMNDALIFFKRMPEHDVVSWTTMVAGYAQHGQVKEAKCFFQEMPERDTVSWTAMVSAYAQQGMMEEAYNIFEQMPDRDVISWNAMISGYAQQGRIQEALLFFRQIQQESIKPDPVTFFSILEACANQAALLDGKQVHVYILRSSLVADTLVNTALVNMYGKCGNLEDACTVFNEMPDRLLFSWNTMISTYSQHGRAKEVLQSFVEMVLEGMRPDNVTFLSMFSACCNSALLDGGYHNLVSMSQNYNHVPILEHYSCMFDLLGRIGLLEIAESSINSMPHHPDATCWRALLGSCILHDDTERGKCVAELAFQLDPEHAGAYVLLSNIYAAAQHSDAQKVFRRRKVESFTVSQ